MSLDTANLDTKTNRQTPTPSEQQTSEKRPFLVSEETATCVALLGIVTLLGILVYELAL